LIETARAKRPLLRAAVLILSDLVMLEAAFLATYWFRFHAGVWPAPLGVPPFELYLAVSLVVLVVFFGIFYALGLYAEGRMTTIEEQMVGLIRGVALGGLLLLGLAFFVRAQTFSRSFFGLYVLSSMAFLFLGRVVARKLLLAARRRGETSRRLLFVGASPMRDRTLRVIRQLPSLDLAPVGWIDLDREDGLTAGEGGAEPLPLRRLGGMADLRAVVEREKVEIVALTFTWPDLPRVKEITDGLANLNVDVQLVPDLAALATSRLRLTEVGGVPFISLREGGLRGVDRIVKRSFDLVLTGLALVVLLPLLALLALLVKAGSPGPVFYRQDRVGRDGREFAMIKFRTMRPDAETASGPVWTVADDPRVTGIGRFLRRFSLDELPQLWNVWRGDMSLIGPRPERRRFVDEFIRSMPRYFERHRVRSGLTGWAQVHGLRGNTSIEERTVYDLYYVENWSLWLDIRIILMTIHHVLRGENAY